MSTYYFPDAESVQISASEDLEVDPSTLWMPTEVSVVAPSTSTIASFQASYRSDASLDSTSEGTEFRWLEYVDKRLHELLTNSVDSGDVDAAQMSLLIGRAREFAFTFLPPNTPTPSITVTPSDELELTWLKAGWTLEITFEEEGTYAWARDRNGTEFWSGYLDEVSLQLKLLIQRIAQSAVSGPAVTRPESQTKPESGDA